jgi:peptidoglycan-N-acetylglucosamine deacetylase
MAAAKRTLAQHPTMQHQLGMVVSVNRALSALVLCLSSTASLAQSLSLTFDDGLNPDREPNAALWNAQILTGLREANVTAMIFPSLSRIGGRAGMNLIRAWTEAGHSVGNHTSAHRSLASPQLSLNEFIADVVEADAALSGLPRFIPLLRFPFLKEGSTSEKRDGIRSWMNMHGYKPAYVSIDASDWYYSQIYVALLNADATAKAEQVKREYISHLIHRANYYDRLAKQVLGRSPQHVMLLHTNAINAAAVREIVAAFKARGWEFLLPAVAFSDPMYTMQPNTLPAGESIVWAIAKERGIAGLRYPAEDSVYEEPRLKSLGLLPEPTSK